MTALTLRYWNPATQSGGRDQLLTGLNCCVKIARLKDLEPTRYQVTVNDVWPVAKLRRPTA
jgi:hypothetical protein